MYMWGNFLSVTILALYLHDFVRYNLTPNVKQKYLIVQCQVILRDYLLRRDSISESF